MDNLLTGMWLPLGMYLKEEKHPSAMAEDLTCKIFENKCLQHF
jgi:hypothetical protein